MRLGFNSPRNDDSGMDTMVAGIGNMYKLPGRGGQRLDMATLHVSARVQEARHPGFSFCPHCGTDASN